MIRALGYAGLVPFVALAFLAWQPLALSAAAAVQLFHIYSCLILGFMAGALWPVLYRPEAPNPLALLAVTFPVLAFLAFALAPQFATPILALLFIALRVSEIASGIDSRYAQDYRRLRWQLTTVVVLCHVAVHLGA